MNRCDYCKKPAGNQKTAVRIWESGRLKTMELAYCSDACKQKLHTFAPAYNRFAPRYMPVVLVWMLSYIVIPLIVRATAGNTMFTMSRALLIAIMGLVLIFQPRGIMPIKYYRRVGLRYFTLFIRITGFLMVMSGLIIIGK